MPVSGATVENPAEKGRKTWIKFKLSIFFVNDGYGAALAARLRPVRIAPQDFSLPLLG
jgi:hypothetical protein